MNIRKVKNDRWWLAIANVRPRPDSDVLDGAPGAHVRVFGLARDEAEFRSGVERLLNALEFDVIEVDEVERLGLSDFRERVTDDVFDTAKTLNSDTPVGYGTFYTYPAN